MRALLSFVILLGFSLAPIFDRVRIGKIIDLQKNDIVKAQEAATQKTVTELSAIIRATSSAQAGVTIATTGSTDLLETSHYLGSYFAACTLFEQDYTKLLHQLPQHTVDEIEWQIHALGFASSKDTMKERLAALVKSVDNAPDESVKKLVRPIIEKHFTPFLF